MPGACSGVEYYSTFSLGDGGTRIPGLIREQDFGGVRTRFIGHMHMQWHIC